jgi:CubicO group peptidase (beta-lactamase class C family)
VSIVFTREKLDHVFRKVNMTSEISYAKLEQVLEKIRACWGIPGMAVGIVEGNKIAYAHGFGVQSLETSTPATDDSIFCLASISKCFVASAILQLVEQGFLDLDGSISQYLPYFRLNDDHYKQITLRQILSHSAGIPDMDENEYDDLVANPEYDEGAVERYVRGLSSRKMIAAPGERFAYSNIAYNVLGDLITKISGQTFESYMKENILNPSGMPESTFYYPEVPHDRIAMPHLRAPGMMVNPVYPYHRADAPSSFLHSTVREMCHWAITSLNRGVYEGKRILNPESYDLMWRAVVKRGFPPWREEMGLGWSLGHFEGRQIVGHGGGGFGWTCLLCLLPQTNQAAIVLCNEESSAHDRAMVALARAILDEDPKVGTISWMIPIATALEIGGIKAAYDQLEKIKENSDYYLNADDLNSLYFQLRFAKKYKMAEKVLELNLYVFPENLGLHLFAAKNFILRNRREKAEYVLQRALEIAPGNSSAMTMLKNLEENS